MEVPLKAETRFIFFPGGNTPNLVQAAVAIYWISFLVFFVRLVFGVGVPPFRTRPEVEATIMVFVFFSAILIFYAFTIMRLSARKRWARNVALSLTAFGIVVTVYRSFAYGPSGQNDVVGMISVAAETVAGLFLLTPQSLTWFKPKIS